MGGVVFTAPKIECDITDVNGKTRHVVAQVKITNKNLREFGNMLEAAEKLPPEKQLAFKMAHIYGGKEEDYDDYECRVLTGAVNHFINSNQNPTSTAGA